MAPGAIDYASSYFKYKTPTPIRGEPTNKTLKRLQMELQANASSVETDLGGGDHGYLGLVLSNVDYGLIPDTEPFIAPTYPTPLNIPADATPIQALELKDTHAERKRIYLECKNVEKALLRHIQDAIEDRYIESLVDEYTNLFTDDVPTVMEYLFYNYGRVRAEEVAVKENEVMNMSWQPHEPIVLLTRPIENLQKLAQQAGIPYTDKQLLEKGLQLIRNTRDFEYALTHWEQKPEVQRTWAQFKTHFHEAQLNLKKIRGPTMQQAGFHQANIIAQQIRADINTHLEERDSQVLAMLQSIPDLTSSSSGSTSEEEKPSNHQANAMVDQTQLEILRLLKEIAQDLKKDKRGQPQGNRVGVKTPDDAKGYRKHLTFYCWTHGMGTHDGKRCRSKAPGHKQEATKDNRMGGSNAYCS